MVDPDSRASYQRGRLRKDEARDVLCAKVAGQPEDADARAEWLGYLHKRLGRLPLLREEFAEQVLWFVRERPQDPLTPQAVVALETSGLQDEQLLGRVKSAWLGHLDREPPDSVVLRHAAEYFKRSDPALALAAAHKAEELDPEDPEVHLLLGALCMPDGGGAEAATAALGHYERACDWSCRLSPEKHSLALYKAAHAALTAGETDKARTYAARLLEIDSGLNRGQACHWGNVLLGRVALRAGDATEAKQRLRQSADVEAVAGAPSLASFGPSMALASELLEHGDREAVLEYLEQCGKFWKADIFGLRLKWIAELRRGQRPDFRPNAQY